MHVWQRIALNDHHHQHHHHQNHHRHETAHRAQWPPSSSSSSSAQTMRAHNATRRNHFFRMRTALIHVTDFCSRNDNARSATPTSHGTAAMRTQEALKLRGNPRSTTKDGGRWAVNMCTRIQRAYARDMNALRVSQTCVSIHDDVIQYCVRTTSLCNDDATLHTHTRS